MVKTEKIPKGYLATEAGILPVDWQVKRLSEVATELTERAGQDKYETVSISAGIGFVNQAEKFGKELSGKQYEKYIVLHQGDFSYNKGNSKTSPQGCIYCLNDRETAAVPNVFESFRIEGQNADYYEQLFLSGFLNKQLYSKINRGVRDDGLLNLTGKDFYSCTVPVPPIAEQKKIAEVLSCCDRVIELKQQLIAELQRLKSGFLQTMFPAKGHSEPDIRFPEFSDAWEQRKLGEVLIGLQNNTLSRANLSSEQGIAKNVHYGDILVKFGEVIDVKTESLPMIADEAVIAKYQSSFLQNGDVILADTAEDETVGKCTEIAGLGDEIVISGLHTIPYRPVRKFASGYLGYYMNSASFHNQLLPLMQGIKVTSISKTALQNTDIIYPKSATEQEDIGKYFCQLDNLVTLHQRGLEETKKKKKSLAKLLLTGSVRVPT